MTPILVALGGEPCTGKTTVMRAFLNLLPPDGRKVFHYGRLTGVQFPAPDIYALGIYERAADGFQGTDRLSMSAQPDALGFLFYQQKHAPFCKIVFEGDRLFNLTFLQDALRLLGPSNMHIFVLSCSPAVLSDRHAFRADGQDEAWLRGRATKIENICQALPVTRLRNEQPEDTALAASELYRTVV